MPRDASLTRKAILAAADELFYADGLRAVSVDAIAAKARVTKKTLYYHFKTKDELITAYLVARDQPTLKRFQSWAGSSGPMARRVSRMFGELGLCLKSRAWKGCGFVRAAGELAGAPKHPALRVARVHKARFEQWLADGLAAEGRKDSESLARELMLLVDGAVSQMLVHRSPTYAEAAARAAQALLRR
jgi:AcrR family transcriptional regulator